MKTITKIFRMVISVILGFISILLVVLILYSPGKSEPFLDSDGTKLAGSISEKTFVTIGGVRQGMFIKSKNKNNPVLLFLHGGIPMYYLTKKYPTGLEDYFTIVWWEQRGSGLSYNSNIPPETMTSEQMISDAVELTNYLRQRFGQEKIYLMAHSGGTFFGIQTAAQHPELFHAYIGVSQISNQLNSERLAYDYMLKRYKETDNRKMVRKLENASISDGISDSYLQIRDKGMHELGVGTTRDMKSVFTGIFIPSLTCKEYTVKEKFNMWRGKSQSGVSSMWDEILTTDLKDKVTNLDIPVYFFSGVYDYTTSYTLSKAYFERLNAPIKGFYSFEKSAHSPIFEEPLRLREIIENDVLNGKTGLSDTVLEDF
jgi:pimeloyl-ACP methyl ester carboxylesterase